MILRVCLAVGIKLRETKNFVELTTLLPSRQDGTAVLADSEGALTPPRKTLEVMAATGMLKTPPPVDTGTPPHSSLRMTAAPVPESRTEREDSSLLNKDNEFDTNEYFDTILN